jgi:NitT/TauT family transport system substrate-binding protein
VHAPFFLAERKGWFKAADLAVAIEDGNGSATTAQLVGAGQFDVGHAALAPMALGRSKGLSVISVACFCRRGDTGIVVPEGSGWTKPADMIDKTMVYTAGSLEGPFMTAFFEKNKVPLDKLKMLNVDASAKVSLYVSKKADACVTTVPFVVAVTAPSRPSTGILFADFGMNLPGFGLVVNTKTTGAKKEALKRFASIVAGAWTYILAGHEQEGVDAIIAARPESPIPAPILLAEINAYKPYFATEASRSLPIGPQTDVDWMGTIEDMASAGTIPGSSKPADFYTNDFLDPAMIEKVAKNS